MINTELVQSNTRAKNIPSKKQTLTACSIVLRGRITSSIWTTTLWCNTCYLASFTLGLPVNFAVPLLSLAYTCQIVPDISFTSWSNSFQKYQKLVPFLFFYLAASFRSMWSSFRTLLEKQQRLHSMGKDDWNVLLQNQPFYNCSHFLQSRSRQTRISGLERSALGVIKNSYGVIPVIFLTWTSSKVQFLQAFEHPIPLRSFWKFWPIKSFP